MDYPVLLSDQFITWSAHGRYFVGDVTERLANYRRVREIIEEICEINRELLRRRDAL